jgi:hypothetical protein
MSTTLVTCYYPLKSKYPPTHYIQWAQDFLQLDAYIVLFTEPHLAELFRLLHKGPENKLLIVETPFVKLEAWKRWAKEWCATHDRDPEKGIHTPELYAIWAQKAFFVKEVVERNPFHTNRFFWCDIGAFRTGLHPEIQTSFPDARHLPEDRILMSSVAPLIPIDTVRKPDGIKGMFLHVNRIVGGLWGGGRTGCLRWHAAYVAMLERYFAAGRFAGKDQSVMLSAYLEDPSLAHIVSCNIGGDIWFYLTHLCSSQHVPYQLDPSYLQVDPPIVCAIVKGDSWQQLSQIGSAYAYAKQHGAALQLLCKDRAWNTPHIEPYYVEELQSDYTPVSPLQFSDICDVRDDLRTLFSPSDDMLRTIYGTYGGLLAHRERIIVVYASRTDVAILPYYVRACADMAQHVRDPIFVLCSDDPSLWHTWISQIPTLHTSLVHILDNSTPSLLSLFQWFIMGHSTVHWWAAWLAHARRVYTPKTDPLWIQF